MSAPFDIAPLSRRERDDGYRSVVARLNSGWRVIVCADHLQWIVQRACAGRARTTEWRAVGFYRTRNALTAACARLCGHCDPAAMAMLAALPDAFGR
jgi:hypothetical protein